MSSTSSSLIEIINNQDLISIDPRYFQSLASNILARFNIKQASLNILFVDNKRIHEINNQFLQHDFPTDVITFPMNEISETPPQQSIEGEIVISAEMAKEMAESVGWSARDELALYLIHALLHLYGYDDLNEQDQLQMRRKEKELLIAAGISPRPNDSRWNDLM